MRVVIEYRSVMMSNTPNAIQKAVYGSVSEISRILSLAAYQIKALPGAYSPEMWSIALKRSSEKKADHATGDNSRNVEFWLGHDCGMLQKKMDAFEKHEGQDVQQVVCVFILRHAISIKKQYPLPPTTHLFKFHKLLRRLHGYGIAQAIVDLLKGNR
jgi:hypothetical protein